MFLPKKHVIITACDQKYGDFLIFHWLKSLKDNVDLTDIDVVVLDYGLPKKHLLYLERENILVVEGKKDGRINNVRFRDVSNFLKKNHYDQVLTIDGGDIIFQTDISQFFEKDKGSFRAVLDGSETLFFEVYSLGNFRHFDASQIKKVLKNKKTINAGVIFAPADKLIKLGEICDRLISNKWSYGPDQIVVNYLLYKQGFKKLDKKLNFVLCTNSDGFAVKKGTFYLKNGEKINIVHNAGREDVFRTVVNFGYKKEFTLINYIAYIGQKLFYSFLDLIKHDSL